MPKGIIKDTLTGLYCSDYSTSLPTCSWDIDDNDAQEFPTLQQAEDAAADMNGQAGVSDRFVGQNPPKPR